jgi:outer membrane protein OmpA-like peptidoglycan-associated protein
LSTGVRNNQLREKEGWNMRHASFSLLVTGLLLTELVGLPRTVAAEQLTMDDHLSVSQMIERLKPQDDLSPDAEPTRALRLSTPSTKQSESPSAGTKNTTVKSPSIDIHVLFARNSAELTPEMKEVLDRVGMALQSNDLADYAFLIGGHTDAAGSSKYNKMLSERRAAAVRDYLVKNYRLENNRLESVGYGKEQLLDPTRPTSEINRRVQVVNKGKT